MAEPILENTKMTSKKATVSLLGLIIDLTQATGRTVNKKALDNISMAPKKPSMVSGPTEKEQNK